MLIRTKLLLLGLATVALPWAGCEYAREMEGSLRVAESASLLAVAETIATSLQGRRDVLYRGAGGADSQAAPGADDFEPVPLMSEPQMDGEDDDWPRVTRGWRRFGPSFAVLTGTFERSLYVLAEADEGRLVFDASDAAALDPAALGDRLWLGFTNPAGEAEQVFVSGWSAGEVRGRRIARREFGRPEIVEEPRVTGAWQPKPGGRGWIAEIRIPLSMVGERFGVLLDDRAQRGATPRSFGSLASDDLAARGRLIAAAPELADYLAQFRQPGVRLTAATPTGAILAETSALPAGGTDPGGLQSLLSQLYRRFIDRAALAQRPPELERGRIDAREAREAAAGRSSTALFTTSDQRRLVVAAAAPIREAQTGPVIGVLQVAQTADRWLLLRDRALTRLLNLTLLVSAGVLLAILVFGTRLALRLERVRRASDAALTLDGRLSRSAFPESESGDELGDVARGFSELLGRLDDYTTYLRTLAGKLAHELRTPLTIVRSSLENLESESLSPAAKVYAERARDGSERLGGILQAMGAASRVEEAIRGAERTRFDLGALLASAVEAYRGAFPERRFALDAEPAHCEMTGAPELVLQMLDKLVDNAVDFSPVGSTIELRLRADAAEARIEVANEGPPLPPESATRLFESLWQRREDGDGKPHFGLGLYIVKLIADFHRGRALAANRTDAAGAVFAVTLARESAET